MDEFPGVTGLAKRREDVVDAFVVRLLAGVGHRVDCERYVQALLVGRTRRRLNAA